MKTIAIQDKSGRIIDRIENFPETVEEITLSQFTSFDAAVAKREKWLAEWGDKKMNRKAEYGYLKMTIEMLSEFLNKDVSEYPLGDWAKHVKGLKSLQNESIGVEGTVLSLLANVDKVVKQHKQEIDPLKAYEFEYEGERFTVDPAYRDAVTNKNKWSGIESARVIEALKMYDAYIENRDKDQSGNFFFTSLLYAIACFSKKEAEVFPDQQADIERHVSERVRFFEGINMKDGLNVAAFFLNISNVQKQTQANVFFGSLLRKLQAV